MYMPITFVDNWIKGYAYLLSVAKENQKEIAAKVGYDHHHIGHVKNGHSRPGNDFMEKLSKYFGYTPEEVSAMGKQIREGKPIDVNGNNESPMDDFQLVPMAKAKPQGGTSSLEVESETERHYAFRIDFLFRKGSPNNIVMFRVGGDSMHPIVADGDTVLVDLSQTHLRDGKMYLVRIDDDILVKWVIRQPGQIILRSENKSWGDMVIDKNDESIDFQSLGQVLWIGKEIT